MPEAADRAEVAFAVADAWQGRGIATLLLAELHVRMPARLGEEGRERFEERDDAAAVAAVGHVLEPSSIAVVGASQRPDSVGGAVLASLLDAGFTGLVYAVNPHRGEIAGLPAYGSVAELPGPAELAVIAVAAPAVLGVARDCAAHGVRALVVLSAGFGESGADGRARQAELLRICRDGGMRLVGPNCLGVLNTDPAVRLDATFSPGHPPAGRIAFASQSGAYGIAALELAARRGLGLSSFVSMGDKADLSGNDFLRYWERDARTDIVLLYLESLGNPRRFGQIARRLTAVKPVVAVKSGRSRAGRRAASSHTGALLEASEATVDALFQHAGVIRVETLDEQLDVAALLAHAPLPAGDRVAIVTNAGGPAITCADACAGAGLRVEPLAAATSARLAALLPAAAAVGNPVDMLATAPPDDFRRTIEVVAADSGVDAIIAIFIPPLPGRRSEPVLAAMRAGARAAARHGVCVVGVVMAPGTTGATGPAAQDHDVALYAMPEQAARALGHVAAHARRARTPAVPAEPPPDVDADAAAAVLAEALAMGPGWLSPEHLDRLLAAYGIPLAATRLVRTPHAAGGAAAAVDCAVALKAIAPGLVHKTDAGAVRLDLRGRSSVARAARDMQAALAEAGVEIDGFLVQPMAPPGAEMLVGVVGDERFGPVVACAAGGTAVELLGDVQVRLAPVSAGEAAAMVRGLRTFALLDGYRGAAPADVAALEDVVVRAAALAAAHDEIAELDLNPVIVGTAGAVVVDARVRIERPPRRAPLAAQPQRCVVRRIAIRLPLRMIRPAMDGELSSASRSQISRSPEHVDHHR